MHLTLIGIVVALAWVWRWQAKPDSEKSWQQRWQGALASFALPPLLLLGTALSIALMGTGGRMWGMPASKLSSLLAIAFLICSVLAAARLLYLSWQDERRLRAYPQRAIAGATVRLAPTDWPASAYVGVCRPEILLTAGLLDRLDIDRVRAVLAHERAHAHYRDTFWFFWLGCLRAVTAWLPQTEILWQELLLLRELRADRRAASQSDALDLAEALVEVARFPLEFAEARCAPFSCAVPGDRLQERIDALLTEPSVGDGGAEGFLAWGWYLWAIALLPLAILPFHCHC